MMKKIIVVIALCVGMTLVGFGNKDWFDTTYKYDKAIIALQDGTIVQGEVQNWTDYEDGDQLQVKVDGKVYLAHSSNVTLIKEQ